jgi:hypothetical protein
MANWSTNLGNDSAFIVADEIRNPKIKAKILSELTHQFQRLPKEARPHAGSLLSRNLELCSEATPLVKRIIGEMLRSKKTAEVEYGLRNLLTLHKVNPLSPLEVGRVVKILTVIPEQNSSPMIRAKVEEAIKTLQSSPSK